MIRSNGRPLRALAVASLAVWVACTPKSEPSEQEAETALSQETAPELASEESASSDDAGERDYLAEVERKLAESQGQQVLRIDADMSRWASRYRSELGHLLPIVQEIEAGAVTRQTCNSLLRTVYNAKAVLEDAPDPDITHALELAIDNLSEAGKYCLQEQVGPRDVYMVLGRTGIYLLEEILKDRYALEGVPGLAVPAQGNTEIGRRATKWIEENFPQN